MKVERVIPKPQPEFRLTFERSEAWAIVAALREYEHRHPDAAYAEDWLRWAKDLDTELRRP